MVRYYVGSALKDYTAVNAVNGEGRGRMMNSWELMAKKEKERLDRIVKECIEELNELEREKEAKE